MTSCVNNNLNGTDRDKQTVGLALRTFVAYLDNQLFVPNLCMELSHNGGNNSNSNIPSLQESGESSMTLGDAFRYYLKYYCSSGTRTNNGNNARFLSIGDSVATCGALAATGTAFVSPLGAAVSVAALAAKDGMAAAARRGRQARVGNSTSSSTSSANHNASDSARSDSSNNNNDVNNNDSREGYKFGDVTRGLSSFLSSSGRNNSNDNNNTYLQENKGRFAVVAGQTAGAAAGLVVLGPIGALAGSMLGAVGTQRAVKRHDQEEQQRQHQRNGAAANGDGGCGSENIGNNDNANTNAPTTAAVVASDGGGRFRIGDNLRGLVARGSDAVGRKKTEGYRFGDFSRGLVAAVQTNCNTTTTTTTTNNNDNNSNTTTQ